MWNNYSFLIVARQDGTAFFPGTRCEPPVPPRVGRAWEGMGFPSQQFNLAPKTAPPGISPPAKILRLAIASQAGAALRHKCEPGRVRCAHAARLLRRCRFQKEQHPGWGAVLFGGATRNRTGESRICSPLPYRLAMAPYKRFAPFGANRFCGAAYEARTRDLHLGKVALYRMS